MSSIERQLRRKQLRKIDEFQKENRQQAITKMEERLKAAEVALSQLIQYLRTRRMKVQQGQTETVIGEVRTETGLIVPQ